MGRRQRETQSTLYTGRRTYRAPRQHDRCRVSARRSRASMGTRTAVAADRRRNRRCSPAMELLNAVGLSDAVVWRARPHELSTGQRERARLALLLAESPNLVLLDEFAAHLDPALAGRVARKVGTLLRRLAITAVIATHRPEVVGALQPDRLLVVGYGGVVEASSPQ
ncbi:MAG: ATP-binding cassette domain-containing protein [Thermomicrobium sp.]|uniref:ATP-binding cassette domain-containing protein n=1 Tax=Thermomicrobium sp. TaxID=1969469 RepID=UPI001B27F369|nr:ATP-binding cassette domain-containing protein [Thermomicrobium sp.]MBO9350663.1 ATP-binding cassette domain-containing protein [Thermomicrobium sp.]